MSRFRCVVLLLLTTAAPLPAAEPAARNVVLIVADDLGRNDLGCYGSRFHKTPNLDRLASRGARFDAAYSAAPVCSPTRAALLTGRYPARLQLTDWLPGRPDQPSQPLLRARMVGALPPSEVTLAGHLRRARFATGHVGKWHLGGEGADPLKFGFDVNVAGDATGTPRSYFAPFRDAKGNPMPGLEEAPAGEYLTDRLEREAEKFLEQHRDRPFFLHLAHYAPHLPLKAPAELIARYPAPMQLGRQSNPIYAAMLESLDRSVGKLLDKLDELKLTDSTLVVFTSDNGGLATREGPDTPATYNGPFREGKGYLYEGGLRVPLILRGPGAGKPGQVITTPVTSIDLLPTLLEMTGQKVPDTLDGVSLSGLLAGTALEREALYWHYPHTSNQGGQPGGAIRQGDWKLIEFFETGRRELFHLGKDPSESQNLAEQEPKLRDQLHEKLKAWRVSVDAAMPQPNPDYRPNPQAADGRIAIHARTARVFGAMLRYEPLPHKETLGYWVRKDDYAEFDFTVVTPGKFRLEILQGCGNGSGGSEVEFRVGDSSVITKVEETGGFQNFKPRVIGTLAIDKPGRQVLRVSAKSKPGPAVMDLRSLTLTPEGGKK